MKITAFLYIETALLNNTQLKPEIHECMCASFFRTFATNALPAIGHTLYMPQTPIIGRYCDRHRYHSSDLVTIEPVVIKVRNVLERGVMSCDVIYKQRVEFTNSDIRLPIDEATGHLIETEVAAIDRLEAAYFHDVIRPALQGEGFLFNYSSHDTKVPQRDSKIVTA